MSTTISPSMTHLVTRLERDIRLRGLQPGDRYFTAAEAAGMLGVSTTSAQRALKLLAERDYLVRRSKAGTFIGPSAVTSELPEVCVRTVHVFLPDDLKNAIGHRSGMVMAGIHDEIPEANIQFTFLPTRDPVGFVKELMDFTREGGRFFGVIAWSCPRSVYRFLAEMHLPLVILGSPYFGDPTVPSVDDDNDEAGRLLVDYLIGQGCRRMMILESLVRRPGDDLFQEGARHALHGAGLPPQMLSIRTVPPEVSVYKAAVAELMGMKNPPTGIICRSHLTTEWAAASLTACGNDAARKVEVVFHGTPDHSSPACPYVRACPKLSEREVAAIVARMLRCVARKESLEENRILIPVELHGDRKKT